MKTQLRPALVLFLLLSLITGLAYPLLVTGIAQLAFPAQANGSLIVKDGKAVGSALIGQPQRDNHYNLRSRARHNLQLPARSTALNDRNFITRMLYKNMNYSLASTNT